MFDAIGEQILEAHIFNDDLILLLENEEAVQNVNPNFEAVKSLSNHAVTITAKGNSVDFVSRFFAPNVGVSEDPVTGSSHTILTPFWAKRLQKNKMKSKQLSKRKGSLICENCGDRVKISGEVVLYLHGEIEIK